MSIRVMTLVWDRSQHTATDLLMMLALADFSDDQGNSYPGVPALALKCRMSTRNANLILAKLRCSGELEVRQNEGPLGTNRYRITLNASAPLKSASPPTPEAGFTPEERFTLKPTSPTPEAGFPKPLKPASDEPSLNRQEPSKRERTRKPSKTAMPEGFDAAVSDRVQAWAASKGFSDLGAHLEHFVGQARAQGYVYADWDQALMNAIRNDWASLRSPQRAGGGASRSRATSAHADLSTKNYREGASDDGIYR